MAVGKIDNLVSLAGELAFTQSRLHEAGGRLGRPAPADLLAALDQLDRKLHLLNQAVQSMRLLPLYHVFARFPRLVHDLAGRRGKRVDLMTQGEMTEVDKGLAERLAAPLAHLVCNSIEHGIELPETRRQAGKPPRGTITLRAALSARDLIIEVEDDGAGLDRARILARAAGQDLQVPAGASDEDVWPLVFEGGFSSTDPAAAAARRGMNLESVRRVILDEGGRIEVRSRSGEGTSMILIIPLAPDPASPVPPGRSAAR